ncbi:MAG: (2Fe-2S) ferredoxin domain-containing protein [Armatimonadota bacterium]
MITVKCCVGSSCHIRGGAKTMKVLKALIDEHNLAEEVDLAADLCLDNCIQAPNVVVDGVTYGGITPDKAETFFFEHILRRAQ